MPESLTRCVPVDVHLLFYGISQGLSHKKLCFLRVNHPSDEQHGHKASGHDIA